MGQNQFKVKGARGRSGLVTAGSVALQALDAPETRDGGGDPSEWIEDEEVVRPDVADGTTEDPPVADAQRDGRGCEDDPEDGIVGDDGGHEVDAIANEIDRTAAAQREEASEGEPEFSPLECRPAPETPVPEKAFGERIVRWAKAGSKLSRTPLSQCLVTVLGFVNLAVMGQVDVMFAGGTIPTNLYILLVARSGSGKSKLYRRLMRPLWRLQDALKREYDRLKAELMADEETRQEVDKLILPHVVFSETTTAALHYFLNRCRGAIGCFNDEIITLLGGHSMRRENRDETIGYFSNLNDAMPITIFRKAEGAIEVSKKRLGILLMGQWKVIHAFITDPMNRQQGVVSRFLMCYPTSLVGTRKYLMSAEIVDADQDLEEYDAFMDRALNRPLPIAEGTTNDLEPRVMKMTGEAEACIAAYDAEIEALMAELGPDSEKIDLVNKSAQMAVRIGATLQRVDELDSPNLEAKYIRGGIQIARYFAKEAIRMDTPPAEDALVEAAKTLVKALKQKNRIEFDATWCYSNGPHSLRTKKALKPVLDFLVDCGWLVIVALPKRPGVAKARKVYRLTTRARRELGL